MGGAVPWQGVSRRRRAPVRFSRSLPRHIEMIPSLGKGLDSPRGMIGQALEADHQYEKNLDQRVGEEKKGSARVDEGEHHNKKNRVNTTKNVGHLEGKKSGKRGYH